MASKRAVEVRNGKLTYGSGKSAFHALRGINLNVPQGIIYGLLGPSGCGKTTLLSSVVGKYTLNDGYVRVFGETPGSGDSVIPGRGVGFMPQELALYPEFTIEETMIYFGRLHQMKPAILKMRTKFLLEFLDLPVKNRLVTNLSGGQQRRVSFAAALIHRPPLLILDEPTVGVDPLLRQNIWNHLVDLTSREGMTVIITTHYIEEARQANVVGLMRKGKLLAEASPQELMLYFNEPSLEECFLKLCKLDKESKGNNDSAEMGNRDDEIGMQRPILPVFLITEFDPPAKNNVSLDHSLRNTCHSIDHNLLDNRIQVPKPPDLWKDTTSKCLTLFWKNLTRLRRNIPILMFQLVMPTIQVILLCLCIGGTPFNLPVSVVNAEKPIIMSAKFLEFIDNKSLAMSYSSSLESSLASVKSGENWAAIFIPSNFSTCLYNRLVMGLRVDEFTLDCSSITVYSDMTNQQVGFVIQKVLLEAFQAFSRSLLPTIGASPRLSDLPIKIGETVYGENKVNFTEFIAPGIILSIIYIMAVGLTALSFVEERKAGLFDRSWVSGVTAVQVFISHIMLQFLVLLVQVSGLLIFTFLVFDVPSRGPFILVILMALIQGVCGMAFGFLISSFVAEESTAIMLALGSFYPNLIMSGIMWPMEGMPYPIRYISYCLPQTLATECIRNVLSRGWGITYGVVWAGFLVSIAWIVLLLTAAIAIFKLKR